MSLPFSVLLSVYAKEKPGHLYTALQSLADQTFPAAEIVLVKDGPLTAELDDVIQLFSDKLPMRIHALPSNAGLASALNEGLKHCSHDWVGRMDSDDIALPERFAEQVKFILDHPHVDVFGCWLEERDVEMKTVLAERKVPCEHDEILKFARHRNPISHPTTMFKKAAVLAVGGYPLLGRAQDYALWSLMMTRGFRFANQSKCLLWMRTGEGLLERRGRDYFSHEVRLLRFQLEIGFINRKGFVINYFARLVLRSVSKPLKRLLYKLAR